MGEELSSSSWKNIPKNLIKKENWPCLALSSSLILLTMWATAYNFFFAEASREAKLEILARAPAKMVDEILEHHQIDIEQKKVKNNASKRTLIEYIKKARALLKKHETKLLENKNS